MEATSAAAVHPQARDFGGPGESEEGEENQCLYTMGGDCHSWDFVAASPSPAWICSPHAAIPARHAAASALAAAAC